MTWRFRRRHEHELDDEIRTHLELAVRDLVDRGRTPEEARALARRQFGNVTIVREAAREVGGWPGLDRLAQDLRHAVRRLRAKPAAALLAVAMLAVAIGMTSAMFTLVDALILRPAPFRDPVSLARLGIGSSDESFNVNVSLPLIRAWRGASGFAAVHAVAQQGATFGTGDNAQAVAGARLTPGLIDELGATPLLGRTFVEGEGRPGSDDLAIVSETVWRGRFGSDPDVVGRRVDISGASVAEHLRSSVRNLPGIDGAAISFGVPPSGSSLYFYDVLADSPGATPVKLVMNSYQVTPEFFRVYGIHLIDGRAFQRDDSADAVIVSRSMATKLWPTTSAVGRTMRFDGRTFRVVGVTREVLNPLLDPRSDEPEMYEPLVSSGPAPDAGPALAARSVSLTIRCGAGCPPLDAVRTHIASASPSATAGAGRHVRDDYAAGLERPRAGSVLAIAFSSIALLAVGAGLFAVLTRVALQRQREFGIRLALGATPADLQRLVHSSSLWIAATGIGTGVALAWALGRILAAVQYQVRVDDPVTWAAVIAVVSATAFAAAWHPARQAMRVNPIALLRE